MITFLHFYSIIYKVDSTKNTPQPEFKKAFSKWCLNNGYDDHVNIGSTRFWDLFNRVLNNNKINTTNNTCKIKGTVHIKGLSIKQVSKDLDIINSLGYEEFII